MTDREPRDRECVRENVDTLITLQQCEVKSMGWMTQVEENIDFVKISENWKRFHFWKKSKFCCLFYVKEAQIYPLKTSF